MLLSRKYNKNIINEALHKAKTLNRSDIIKKRQKRQNDRVVLALTFNPKLPSVSKKIKKTLENNDLRPKHEKNLPKTTNARIQTTT
jgi:hypothetical protein